MGPRLISVLDLNFEEEHLEISNALTTNNEDFNQPIVPQTPIITIREIDLMLGTRTTIDLTSQMPLEA